MSTSDTPPNRFNQELSDQIWLELRGNSEKKVKLQNIEEIINRLEKSSPEHMGGLILQAFVEHQLNTGKEIQKESLDALAKGDFSIIGEGFSNNRFSSAPTNPKRRYTNIRGGENVLYNQANLWALWKVVADGLGKKFENQDIGKRLANSMFTLGVDYIPSNYSLVPQQRLMQLLGEHGYTPLPIKVLEFGGLETALTKNKNPLIGLVEHYEDYTPVREPAADGVSHNPVTIDNPDPRLTTYALGREDKKFDVVIAANVFCNGAYEGKEDHNIIDIDVLPYLSGALRDKGKLIISNTAGDGWNLQSGEMNNVCVEDIGLVNNHDYTPINNKRNFSDDGLYSFTRDYSLRPPSIRYTLEEHEYMEPDEKVNIIEMIQRLHERDALTKKTL